MPEKQKGKRMLDDYMQVYKYIGDQPDVKKFISRTEKQIVINLAAYKDAKIIKLLP